MPDKKKKSSVATKMTPLILLSTLAVALIAFTLIINQDYKEEIQEVESYEFIPVNFPDDLQIGYKKEDPLRSWTVNIDGKNKFVNDNYQNEHITYPTCHQWAI